MLRDGMIEYDNYYYWLCEFKVGSLPLQLLVCFG